MIEKIMGDYSDKLLVQAVKDVLILQQTGILPDGCAKEIRDKIAKYVLSEHIANMQYDNLIMEEAAKRWMRDKFPDVVNQFLKECRV